MGLAAKEALRLATATGVPHHIVEQILSRSAAIEQQARPYVTRRFDNLLPEGA